MKPIGLVTCYFHHNYGSMLQAYVCYGNDFSENEFTLSDYFV